MFLTGSENSSTVKRFLSSQTEKKIAVAFIGKGLSNLIAGDCKIVCNLTTGSTNPQEIKRLMEKPNIQVRNCSDLHAKVYVSETELIVGSPNISTNGIALESEAAKWEEASILTEDAKHVADATSWFDGQWEKAQKIKKKMIEDAEELYKIRRSARSVFAKDIEELSDRNIHCVIYKDPEVPEGAKEVLAEHYGKDWSEQELEVYVNWKNSIPEGKLIEFYYNRNKKVRYIQVCEYNGFKIVEGNTEINIAKKIHGSGYFGTKLESIINDKIDVLWPEHAADESAIVIAVEDVLNQL